MSTQNRANIYWILGGAALMATAIIYLKQAYKTPPENIATELVTRDTVAVEDTIPAEVVVDNTLSDSIIEYGTTLLGKPYIEAGNGEVGFDCSGFVYHVFKQFGIEVPRSSIAFDGFGTEIDITDVEKGDVLLFLSPTRDEVGHVGIVSEPDGLKSHFIHSSSGEAMGVTVSSLTTKGYADRFVKAIRVL